MKPKLLFLLLGLVQTLSAQTFTEKTGTPFEGVYGGSVVFADVDRDGDKDALIVGNKLGFGIEAIAKLYENDGRGNFIENTEVIFDPVKSATTAFSDVDNDDDEDVIIAGYEIDSVGAVPIIKLYENDGQGIFSEKTDIPFDPVVQSTISFSDVDGDGDQDLLITGATSLTGGGRISKMFLNDGTGNFSERTGTPFQAVSIGSVAFSDVDGDDDQDVLITGQNDLLERVAKLYINDGEGNYSEKTAPFEEVLLSSVAFSDVDGDDDQDVLIIGENSSSDRIAKLYMNDGSGNFTEKMGTPFDGVFEGSITFSDVNGDNASEILLTGGNNSNNGISKLYMNDGSGNFTEKTDTPFDGVFMSSVAFSDVDGDDDQDLLITGSGNMEPIAKLYINDGTVSTDELNLDTSLDLQLFPNPSAPDRLYVNYTAVNEGEADIFIYDMKGARVMDKQKWKSSGDQPLTIDISSLPQGSYVLELEDGQRKGRAKFVVH
ncbi:MAG TPA: FG-GAP-like repeat-containing protein [Saprospiraceae bacterium]|nr:FG-GAP-like repeat-containing protein [Saprospiraceae bacterium]